MGMCHRGPEQYLPGFCVGLSNLAVRIREFHLSTLDYVNNDVRMGMHRDLVALLERGANNPHLFVIDKHLGLFRRRLHEVHSNRLGGKKAGCKKQATPCCSYGSVHGKSSSKWHPGSGSCCWLIAQRYRDVPGKRVLRPERNTCERWC